MSARSSLAANLFPRPAPPIADTIPMNGDLLGIAFYRKV